MTKVRLVSPGIRLLALCILAVLSMDAQNDSRRDPVFQSGADLVLVPVTVTNAKGAIVNGLSRSQFQIKENKIVQPIYSVSEEDVPVSMGIILDTSGSMSADLPLAKAALKQLVADTNPDDEAFLYTVSNSPRRETFFTPDFDALLGGVSLRRAYGSTALIDTIYAGLGGLRAAKNARRALLVISDGMDNHSHYSKEELLSLALETDAQIYSISIYNPPAYQKPIQLKEERDGLALLAELASKTGGIPLTIQNAGGLPAAAAQIGRALRDQYVLGYIPQSHERDGKWQSIRVTVTVPHATVYARPGYRLEPGYRSE